MIKTQTWGMPMNPQCRLFPVLNVAVVLATKEKAITRIDPPTPPPPRKKERK